MTETNCTAPDWVGNVRTYALVWGVPIFAMIASLLADVGLRAGAWTVALLWMGMACLINGWRCGRTHCRFTGPFYLVMIVPVLTLGLAAYSVPGWDSVPGWLALGTFVLIGGKVIWWATERAWGKFS